MLFMYVSFLNRCFEWPGKSSWNEHLKFLCLLRLSRWCFRCWCHLYTIQSKCNARHKQQCALRFFFYFVGFKPIAKRRQFKGQAGEQMAEPLLPYIWTTLQNRKATGSTVAVSGFVWPLDYFLKWPHQKAMLGENKGHNMMRCRRRNIVYGPRMMGT